jgi:hypothetical protein
MRRNARREAPQPVISPNTGKHGCSGKRCYESAPVAQKLAKRTRQQHECRVEAYRCHHCHLWHIGEK